MIQIRLWVEVLRPPLSPRTADSPFQLYGVSGRPRRPADKEHHTLSRGEMQGFCEKEAGLFRRTLDKTRAAVA